MFYNIGARLEVTDGNKDYLRTELITVVKAS
jgi:hypothetical protein